MPRKDDRSYNPKSRNERDPDNRPRSPESPISESFRNSDFGQHVSNLADLYGGKQSYSDFTSRFNGYTDGWFSTFANGLPFISNMHNALLGRDSAKDYLENNGLSWSDMQGYNDMKLLGRSSSAIGGLVHQGSSYLGNIGNDLGKLYSGQKQSRITMDKQVYHSNYLDAW